MLPNFHIRKLIAFQSKRNETVYQLKTIDPFKEKKNWLLWVTKLTSLQSHQKPATQLGGVWAAIFAPSSQSKHFPLRNLILLALKVLAETWIKLNKQNVRATLRKHHGNGCMSQSENLLFDKHHQRIYHWLLFPVYFFNIDSVGMKNKNAIEFVCATTYLFLRILSAPKLA